MLNVKKLNLAVILILGLSLSLFAQKEAPKIKKIAQEADVILTGKVAQKKSFWNGEKTRIYTKATVQVDEYLKGKGDDKVIEISYMGGEVGEIGEIYSHTATLDENEEVLLFLKKNKTDKDYKIINGDEGKIKLFRSEGKKAKEGSDSARIRALKSEIKNYLNNQ